MITGVPPEPTEASETQSQAETAEPRSEAEKNFFERATGTGKEFFEKTSENALSLAKGVDNWLTEKMGRRATTLAKTLLAGSLNSLPLVDLVTTRPYYFIQGLRNIHAGLFSKDRWLVEKAGLLFKGVTETAAAVMPFPHTTTLLPIMEELIPGRIDPKMPKPEIPRVPMPAAVR